MVMIILIYALLVWHRNIDHDLVRPGMSGTATVIAPNAGVIGTIASILLWVNAYMAYL